MKLLNETLYMPKGSIRAILILLITIFILMSMWYNKEASPQIIAVWAGAIGWYFGGKKNK